MQKNSQVPKDVQSQVRRLEELVISLMNKTNKGALSVEHGDHVTPDHSPSSSEILVGSTEDEERDRSGVLSGQLKDTALSLGKITIGDGDRANYVGSSHWTAILDNVRSTIW